MPAAARILVLGGSGWLGSALRVRLASRGAVVLASAHAELDVADAVGLSGALNALRPQAVLNLAAAQPGAPEDALRATNVVGARSVAEACARHEIRLVHVSTDMVLDGRTPPYADDAPRNALTPYGRAKAEGEEAVLAAHPGAVCVRTSLLWDPAEMGRGTKAFADRLAAGEPCRLFVDEIRCPLPRAVLADALLDLVDLDVAGTLNVAGREAITRHDFALALLRHFDVPGLERIEQVRSADLERAGAPSRPLDLTLEIDHAEDLLGRPLCGVHDVLGKPR